MMSLGRCLLGCVNKVDSFIPQGAVLFWYISRPYISIPGGRRILVYYPPPFPQQLYTGSILA